MKRAACALCAVIALAGCGYPLAPQTGPEFVYRWVMIHAGNDRGIQIGPKFDAAGSHWSAYWWDYAGGFHDGYLLGDPMSSPMFFDVDECAPNVYCAYVNGRVVLRVPLVHMPDVKYVASESTTK